MKQDSNINPYGFVYRYLKFVQLRGKLTAVDVIGEKEKRKLTIRVFLEYKLLVFHLYDKSNIACIEVHLLRTEKDGFNLEFHHLALSAGIGIMSREVTFPFAYQMIKKFDVPFLYDSLK